MHPDEADPVYFSNGDGDDLYFILQGGGLLRSALGDLPFNANDYVFVPHGLSTASSPTTTRSTGCQSSAPPAFGLPEAMAQ